MAATKLITPVALASYCHLLEPTEDPSGEMKYSVSLIFDKDSCDLEPIEEAIKQAAKDGKLGKKYKNPLRDGDEDREDNEEYENSMFVNANAKRRPGIIDYATGDVVDTDDDDIGVYSGCLIRASVTFFAYTHKGSKGVGCGLNNVQVLKRGERLDGTESAEEAFEDAEEIDLDEL
jgi:hypothetical protein